MFSGGRKTYGYVRGRPRGADGEWKELPVQTRGGALSWMGGRSEKLRDLQFAEELEIALEFSTSDPDDVVDFSGLEYLSPDAIFRIEVDAGVVYDISHIGHLTGLHELDLPWSSIPTDDDFAVLGELRELRRLNFGSLLLTDAGLRHLHRLEKLAEVRIDAHRITESGLADLRRALPRCHVWPNRPEVRELRFPTDRSVGKVRMNTPWSEWVPVDQALGDVLVPIREDLMLEIQDPASDLTFLNHVRPENIVRIDLHGIVLTADDVSTISRFKDLRGLNVDEGSLDEETRLALEEVLPNCEIEDYLETFDDESDDYS